MTSHAVTVVNIDDAATTVEVEVSIPIADDLAAAPLAGSDDSGAVSAPNDEPAQAAEHPPKVGNLHACSCTTTGLPFRPWGHLLSSAT